MAKPVRRTKVMVSTLTTRSFRDELRRIVLEVNASRTFASRGRDLSQEVVLNATWLWMRTLPPDQVAAGIAPYVERIESALEAEKRGEDLPAQAQAQSPAPSPQAPVYLPLPPLPPEFDDSDAEDVGHVIRPIAVRELAIPPRGPKRPPRRKGR